MDVMTQLAAIPGIGPLLPYILGAIAVCALLAPLLPAPKEGATGFYPSLYSVVNFVAINFGHARNASSPTITPKPPVPVIALLAASLLALSACSAEQQAATNAKLVEAAKLPAGQLFCKIQQDGGGAMLVAVANAGVASTAPGALPVSIIATGAAKAYVDSVCAQAGGVPAPPPADLNTTVVQMALTALAPKG